MTPLSEEGDYLTEQDKVVYEMHRLSHWLRTLGEDHQADGLLALVQVIDRTDLQFTEDQLLQLEMLLITIGEYLRASQEDG